MFVDEISITVSSGKGGPGCVSFHRDRHVAKGGPDGGDGGNGGNVYLVVDDSMTNLNYLRYRQYYNSKNGMHGEGRKKYGKKGDDLILKVPRGTVVREQESNDLIVDFNMEVDEWLLCEGGKGGRGNTSYKSSINQTPREFEDGEDGEKIEICLSLKMIADVGFVGFPNAGKSSLLSRISNARPKIADYPFTTMIPHLGTHSLGPSHQIVFADLPGLIEGASDGKGLGIRFLKHIERTKIIMHLVEPELTDGSTPVEKVRLIRKELANYSETLGARKEILVLTKMDTCPDESDIASWEEELGEKFFRISTVSGEGIKEVIAEVWDMLEEIREPT